MAMNPTVQAVEEAGKKKILGHNSLVLGEIITLALGLLIIGWGEKIPFVGKFLASPKVRLAVGAVVIFVGELVW
jgi:hypothetical protein